jgi:hypothetical protein
MGRKWCLNFFVTKEDLLDNYKSEIKEASLFEKLM